MQYTINLQNLRTVSTAGDVTGCHDTRECINVRLKYDTTYRTVRGGKQASEDGSCGFETISPRRFR